MSFVRWSAGSALYIYADARGGVTCCGCPLAEHDADSLDWGNYNTDDLDHMLKHLDAHEVVGDRFPATLRDYLRAGWPLAKKETSTDE